MTHNLQIIGLIYDAAGIAVLGIPAAFRMVDEIAAQSGTYWDYNPNIAKALSTARVDTTVGSVLLLAGFLIQVTSLYSFVATPLGLGNCSYRPWRVLRLILVSFEVLFFHGPHKPGQTPARIPIREALASAVSGWIDERLRWYCCARRRRPIFRCFRNPVLLNSL